MIEFFLHYITADIKYNFWCDEDGHQFREDWVKCRINIKYLDSPNIEVNCYPVNHFESIPLKIDISFKEFRFERAEQAYDSKRNVFAIFWSSEHQMCEILIAIEDRTQYENYEKYLNNMMKICRIAEIERLEAQSDEYSSTSFGDIRGSSLSLFSISAYESIDDHSNNIDEINAHMKFKNAKKRFYKLSRVKNATKSAAKKLNRILVKAKTKLIKPSIKRKADISIISTSTQSTDISTFYEEEEMDEFEEVNLAEITGFSPRSLLSVDDWDDEKILEPKAIDHSWKFDASASERSQSSTQTLNETLSSGNVSLIQQVLAESMADLNLICAQADQTPFKSNKKGKIVRKGTPYKMKVPKRLTLYDASDEKDSEESSNDAEERIKDDLNLNEYICIDSSSEIPKKMLTDEGHPVFEPSIKSHFILNTAKELLSNQLTRKYHRLYQKFLSKPRFLLHALAV